MCLSPPKKHKTSGAFAPPLYTDTEVGNEYGRSRSTADYWKHAALKQLRKEWLKSEHEEQEADTL